MSRLSVRLTSTLEAFVNTMVASGCAANKADVARKALAKMVEEETVVAICTDSPL